LFKSLYRLCRAQDFNKVIYASFAAMAVVYGLVAGAGYYYFGDAASTLITTDLTNNSPYTGQWVRCWPLLWLQDLGGCLGTV